MFVLESKKKKKKEKDHVNNVPGDADLSSEENVYASKQTRGPVVLYRSPECWGYVKISGYRGKEV